MNAATENYLPVVVIGSTQASTPVVRRYRNAKLLVLTGVLSDDDTVSTYAFFRNVVGFELDTFFKNNTTEMRRRCLSVLQGLLKPE